MGFLLFYLNFKLRLDPHDVSIIGSIISQLVLNCCMVCLPFVMHANHYHFIVSVFLSSLADAEDFCIMGSICYVIMQLED